MSALPPAGVIRIDKPETWTSHDVVAFLRPRLGMRRMGHAGTLDPLASGLLLILYGHATKLSADLHRLPKTYLADVALGSETTTDDREGEVIARADVPARDDHTVRRVLASFLGRREQVPPAFSAIHVGGQRAYARSRRGETVELAPRSVEFTAVDLVERQGDRIRVRVSCSAGTYVRAFARDLGRALGTRAHLAGLRRLIIGPFSVEGAPSPERIVSLGIEAAAALILTEDAARRLLAEGDTTSGLWMPTSREGNQPSG